MLIMSLDGRRESSIGEHVNYILVLDLQCIISSLYDRPWRKQMMATVRFSCHFEAFDSLAKHWIIRSSEMICGWMPRAIRVRQKWSTFMSDMALQIPLLAITMNSRFLSITIDSTLGYAVICTSIGLSLCLRFSSKSPSVRYDRGLSSVILGSAVSTTPSPRTLAMARQLPALAQNSMSFLIRITRAVEPARPCSTTNRLCFIFSSISKKAWDTQR